MKKGEYPLPKSVVFHDNKGSIFPKEVVVVDIEAVVCLPTLEGG
jgi:hypothetical protein